MAYENLLSRLKYNIISLPMIYQKKKQSVLNLQFLNWHFIIFNSYIVILYYIL